MISITGPIAWLVLAADTYANITPVDKVELAIVLLNLKKKFTLKINFFVTGTVAMRHILAKKYF